MTVPLERRGFLFGLGALALLPGGARASGRSPFETGHSLERVLRRSLSDGKEIVVTRRWRIAFAPAEAGGIRVSGEQTHAQVEAPPALRALSDIEARRRETGFLPLLLDSAGLIVSPEDRPPPAPLPDEAVALALEYARSRAAGPEAVEAARRFVADLSERGRHWLTQLPRDLFFPVARDRSTRREIALPDGTQGVIRMREIAVADPATGLLVSFLREAETIADAASHKGSETWTLGPAVF